jgi:hypothetical protein
LFAGAIFPQSGNKQAKEKVYMEMYLWRGLERRQYGSKRPDIETNVSCLGVHIEKAVR